jgi:hypothetical protein
MENNQLQVMFFQYIKSKVPSHLSLVDEIANLLEISTDSAYRRIRGEKMISLEEVTKMASYFKVSIDQLLNLKTSDAKIFSGNYITPANFNFEMYLQKMLEVFIFLNSFKSRELLHFCKDIVTFYYFPFPELAAFKNYAWMKTILNFPDFAHRSFSSDMFDPATIDLSAKIARQYTLIPGSEIMNVSNIHTTLYQIEYYKTAHKFCSNTDLQIIYEQLHKMVDHIEAQAENGVKFMPGEKPNSQSVTYNLYVNDFVTGDNSYLAIIDGKRVSYLVHNHLNYLTTNDEMHTTYHENFLKNIMQKSILLSKSGEKFRSGFFYLIHDEIEKSRTNQLKTFGNV